MKRLDSAGARRNWPLAAVIGIGVLASVAVFHVVWTSQLRTADVELTTQVDERHKATQEGLFDYEDLIRAVVAHIEGSDGRIKEEVFTVAVARLLATHEGIRALGYAPRVSRAARGTYETVMPAHTQAGFEIVDPTDTGKRVRAGDRDQYFPIVDVVPLAGNEPLRGLDLGSSWRELLDRARDTGGLVSTDLIRATQTETGGQGEFFVVGPAYSSSASTVGERRASLVGFAVAAFRIDNLFGTILRTKVIARGFDEYVFRGSAADQASLVYVHRSRFRNPRDTPAAFVPTFAKPEFTRTLMFAGQTWTTVSVPLALLHPRMPQAGAWGTLAGGFIVTALVGLCLYAAARRLDSARVAAAKLRSGEERFRMLMEQAPDAILVFDYDQARFIDANRSAERLFACPREELVKVGPQQFYPPEQPDARPVGASYEDHNQRALAGETIAFERRVRNAQGQDLICEVRLARLPSSEGRFLRASFLDVTERKRNEDRRKQSEESFRTIFNSVNDGIIVHDVQTGAFIDFNPRLCEMFGYTREELLKLDLGGLTAGVPPYTVADAAAILKRAASGEAIVFEWQCKAKDGHLFWIEVSLRRAPFGGHDILLSTARDITERRLAIEALTYRDRILHAVTRSVAELVSGPSLAAAMPRALQIVAAALQVDRMLVLERSRLVPGHEETSLAYSWQSADVPKLADGMLAKYPADSTELAAWFAPLLEGKPVMTDAETASGSVSRIMREQNNRSTLLLPISVAGQYWGHIGVDDCKTRRQWTSAELDALGALVGVMGALLQRECAQTALQESEQRFRTIYDSVNEGIFLVDPVTLQFVDVNPPGCAMFGYAREEIIGRDIALLSSGAYPYTHDSAMEMLKRAQANGPQTFEWRAKNKAGGLLWAELSIRFTMFGSRDLILSTVRDISDRKQAQEQVLRLARYDVLTGLANRSVFVEELEHTITHARRVGNSFAVLYLDLDHFKDVNDTLGHPIGDLLLQAVAQRFRAVVRETDAVARFGGDEFAIIEGDIREPADAAVLAETLLNAISEPFTIEGNVVRSGSSVGIAVFGPDSPDAETLLSHADVALYRAKQEGRGTYRFFTDAMDTEVKDRVALAADLREAITEGQLHLIYQPQVDNQTGRIVGLEALVRWRHPKRGLLSPDEFIPVAEQSGLVVALGHWTLREACRQTKVWLDAGIAPALMSVNLSGLQFKRPLELENDIAAVLEETGLPPQMLELELTESVLMEVTREHNDVLLRLRDSGIKLAIDDFGNGYSSLDYLSRFPVDHIKIAQNFIVGLQTKPRNAAIVRAAIHLAHELDLLVIVEGVETAEELAIIKSWGCRLIQGFYFSKPLSVAEMTTLLRVGTVVPDQPVVATPAAA
jgi:diguanylate cyclase (GGDEF)-like protein/PAS domain S-box-containing protein